MKNRKAFRRTAVSALCVAFALSAASCGEGMITTNSEKDMAQVVGTVNIANHEEFQEGGQYAAYASAISSVNSDILKRDLVAYFLNTGYTYVQSYGYTYEQTFNLLMDNLINRKIIVQYAMAYYFERATKSMAAFIRSPIIRSTSKNRRRRSTTPSKCITKTIPNCSRCNISSPKGAGTAPITTGRSIR